MVRESLMEYLVYLLYPAMILLAIVVHYRHRQKTERSEKVWGDLADDLGLVFRDRGAQDMAIEGTWKGYSIHLYMRTEVRGRGRNERTLYYSRATVEFLDETVGWELSFRLHDGMENIVEDPSLRERFEARFTSSEATTSSLQALLEDERALSTLVDLADNYHYDDVGVVDGNLFVERTEIIDDGDDLRALLEDAIEATRLIEEAASPPEPLPSPEDRSVSQEASTHAHSNDWA